MPSRGLLVLLVSLLVAATGCAGDGDVDAAGTSGAAADPESPARFEVDGTEAVMIGVIGPDTPDEVASLIEDFSEVRTIVMVDVPGSEDDESNLEAAALIRQAGLSTHVPGDGSIASGGVDFYLAGVERTYEPGASFGVHSWAASDEVEGGDLPRDDPEHDLFLDYYASIGIDEAFYWFTLQAAPADGIHLMTEDELARFGIGTPASD